MGIHTLLPSIEFSGPDYRECLSLLHELLLPRRYLEIGVDFGASLELASCSAIGIDPAMRVSQDLLGTKPILILAQQTSDEFFTANDPRAMLGGPIDLAFVDGEHLIEQVLSDFSNIERSCAPGSTIAIHDCLPHDQHMARRNREDRTGREQSNNPNWWTGDVWKLVPILQRYRPDLKLELFRAPPTGLLLATNLDPSSTLLFDQRSAILTEFQQLHNESAQLTEFLTSATLLDPTILQDRATQRIASMAAF